jgi:FdhD protein
MSNDLSQSPTASSAYAPYDPPAGGWRNGSMLSGERSLAEQVPVAFNYDGATHAVLLATPDDLEDLAFGFGYTEGIIANPNDAAELETVEVAEGIVMRMWLTADRSDAFAARRRRFVAPSGFSMCRLESLAEADRRIPAIGCGPRVDRQQIAASVTALRSRQRLIMRTHAVHTAAFWRSGQCLILREDVDGHNAFDKLAGALLRRNQPAADGIVVLSSRISIELVQKAGMLGAAVVVGVSAPTALAVRVADAIGLTLVGIISDGFEVITNPERIFPHN